MQAGWQYPAYQAAQMPFGQAGFPAPLQAYGYAGHHDFHGANWRRWDRWDWRRGGGRHHDAQGGRARGRGKGGHHRGWDHHRNLPKKLRGQCYDVDQACAALITDLKQRDMLKDTLVVWGGEFGRTPMVEASAALGRSKGRDHHPQAFTMWLAGGGIRPGFTLGATDDLGYFPVQDRVHVQIGRAHV